MSEERRLVEELMAALRIMGQQERLLVMDQCLLEVYGWGQILLGILDSCSESYNLCTRAPTIMLNHVLDGVRVVFPMVLGFHF